MKLTVYRNYLLAVLTVIFTFNFSDRFALGLVLENIKSDLGLSDSQLGLLSGIAFALFYSVLGIPIARWTDRGNRVTVIALTAALWSVMVALCGVATNFVQLMLIRVGVGVGEAGCIPPAQSLIADYFNRAERPRANAIYFQGSNISMFIAYFLAGWINEFYCWRIMFAAVGLPGVLLAVLAWYTIKEPRLTRTPLSIAHVPAAPAQSGEPSHPSFRTVCATLWANPSFRHLLYGFSAWYFFAYGIMQWQPAFFVRSFGVKTGELGTWLALVYGVGGMLGLHWGGAWASRYAPHNEQLQLKVLAVANVGFNSVIWPLIYFSHSFHGALAWMAVATTGGSVVTAPLFAMIQSLAPARMRAMAVASVSMFANLIGLGLGPLAVGALSDWLRPWFGAESLRYALLAITPGYLWVSWHLWQASKTVTRDLAAVPVSPEEPADGNQHALSASA